MNNIKTFQLPIYGELNTLSLHIKRDNVIFLEDEEGGNVCLSGKGDPLKLAEDFVAIDHDVLKELGCENEFFDIFGDSLTLYGAITFPYLTAGCIYRLKPTVNPLWIDER